MIHVFSRCHLQWIGFLGVTCRFLSTPCEWEVCCVVRLVAMHSAPTIGTVAFPGLLTTSIDTACEYQIYKNEFRILQIDYKSLDLVVKIT